MTSIYLSWGIYEVIGYQESFNYCSQCDYYNRHHSGEPVHQVLIRPGITSLPYKAFFLCRYLTHVELPYTLQYISDRAFDSTGITDITFPDGLTNVATGAFSGASFKSITLPKAWTSIGENFFHGISSLERVLNFKNILYIGDSAFNGCERLQYIDDYSNVKHFGQYCFASCNFTNFSIPENTEFLGPGILMRNPELETCYIPTKFNHLPAQIFYDCPKLIFEDFDRYIAFGNHSLDNTNITNVTIRVGYSYGHSAFANCKNLENVAIEDGVNSLPAYIFSNSIIKSVVIPETIDNLGVGVFSGCRELANVSFPMHMTEISDYLFNDCNSLHYIEIPKVVTYFGRYCFNACPLINVTICPECWYVGHYAFAWSKNTTILIPEKLDYLGSGVFYNCSELEIFNLSLKKNFVLRSYVFHNCSKFTTIVNNEAISEFGTACFDNCTSLVKNYMTERQDIIVDSLFQRCSSITQFEILPTIKHIGHYAFASTGLANITIPFNVKSIGEGVFFNCSNLTSINFEGEIKTLKWYTFAHCTSLIDFTPSPSVTELGGYCFYNCTAIVNIVLNQYEFIHESTFAYCTSLPNLTFLDGLKTIGDSSMHTCSSITNISIPDSVEMIFDNAFSYCTSLEVIVLPKSLFNIGQYCFYNCTILTSVTLPPELATIMNWAFAYSGIPTITIPYAQKIMDSAFEACQNLESVSLPENLEVLEQSAFRYCTNLTSLTFPILIRHISNSICEHNINLINIEFLGDVRFIGVNSFYNCSRLADFVFPSTLEVIQDNAFRECRSLRRIEFPAPLIFIGKASFANTNITDVNLNLTNPNSIEDLAFSDTKIAVIYLPDNLSTLCTSTFENCFDLVRVHLPKHLNSIGNRVFYECRRLGKLIWPLNLFYIGEYAFYGCNIEKVNLTYTSMVIINQYAFANCRRLRYMFLPYGLKSIEAYAFNYCISLMEFLAPSTLKTVFSYAFNNCHSLEVVKLNPNISVIESFTFNECRILNLLILPPNVTIKANAFYNCIKLQFLDIGINCTIENSSFPSSPLQAVIIRGFASIEDSAFGSLSTRNTIVYYCGEMDMLYHQTLSNAANETYVKELYKNSTFINNDVSKTLDNYICYNFEEQEIPLGCIIVESCLLYRRYNHYYSYSVLSFLLQF